MRDFKIYCGDEAKATVESQKDAFNLQLWAGIRVGVLSHDENKWGKEKSAKNIVGSELYLFHGNNRPTLYDPCFMKTFRTRRGGVDMVRTYREESSRSDVLAVDWTEDIKLTSGISAKRITIT